MLVKSDQLRWIETNLIDNDIAFVVVGGVAVRFYQRSTEANDLDLFVGADPAVIDRMIVAIPQLSQDQNARAKLLSEKVGHFKVGPPLEIDVLTFAPALTIATALQTAQDCVQDGTSIPILSRALLIAHKMAVGAPKDLDDVRLLSDDPGPP